MPSHSLSVFSPPPQQVIEVLWRENKINRKENKKGWECSWDNTKDRSYYLHLFYVSMNEPIEESQHSVLIGTFEERVSISPDSLLQEGKEELLQREVLRKTKFGIGFVSRIPWGTRHHQKIPDQCSEIGYHILGLQTTIKLYQAEANKEEIRQYLCSACRWLGKSFNQRSDPLFPSFKLLRNLWHPNG